MGLFHVGGYFWSPQLVGWGTPGRGATYELKGYYSRRLDGRRGALSAAQRSRQTLDAWSFPGVYALYKAEVLVYVGQALCLGDRLLQHWRQDHLVGRWDAFSWFSPAKPVEARGGLTVPEPMPTKTGDSDLEPFLNEMEALAILLGNPLENRQVAQPGEHFWWLTQLRSEHAEETELSALSRQVAELRELLLARER